VSIGIYKRVIFGRDQIVEIAVESDTGSLSIDSGYQAEESGGHLTFGAEQLPELIEVLQMFLKERSVPHE
jgi:hypothetical protein